MAKTLFLTVIYYTYLVSTTNTLLSNTPSSKCFFSRLITSSENYATTAEDTKTDFYSLVFSVFNVKNSAKFDFASLIEVTKDCDVTNTLHDKVSTTKKFKCYYMQYKLNGEELFIKMLKEKTNLDFRNTKFINSLSSNDIFKLLQSQVIDPTNNELENLEKGESAKKSKHQTVKSSILNNVWNLLSALIFSYNFHQKVNSFVYHDDFKFFLKDTGYKQNSPDDITEEHNNDHCQVILEQALASEENDNKHAKIIAAYKENTDISNSKRIFLHFNREIQTTLVRDIYTQIKKVFADTNSFNYICKLVDTFSYISDLLPSDDSRKSSLEYFLCNVDKHFDMVNDKTNLIFLNSENTFLRHCICRIHPFMYILMQNNDISEYLLMCQSFRKLKNELFAVTKKTDNKVTLSALFRSNRKKNKCKKATTVVKRYSGSADSLLYSIIRKNIMTYMVFTANIDDEAINLEQSLITNCTKIIKTLSLIFNEGHKMASLVIYPIRHDSLYLINHYCDVLSDAILELIKGSF